MKYRFQAELIGYVDIEVEADDLDKAEELALDKFEADYFPRPAGDLSCKSIDLTLLES